jgi:hypothetical protein
MTRYTDLYDAMFHALVINNDLAQEALLALPADQRYVIEVNATADRRGTELRIWRLDLDRAVAPLSRCAPDFHHVFTDAQQGEAGNAGVDCGPPRCKTGGRPLSIYLQTIREALARTGRVGAADPPPTSRHGCASSTAASTGCPGSSSRRKSTSRCGASLPPLRPTARRSPQATGSKTRRTDNVDQEDSHQEDDQQVPQSHCAPAISPQ